MLPLPPLNVPVKFAVKPAQITGVLVVAVATGTGRTVIVFVAALVHPLISM